MVDCGEENRLGTTRDRNRARRQRRPRRRGAIVWSGARDVRRGKGLERAGAAYLGLGQLAGNATSGEVRHRLLASDTQRDVGGAEHGALGLRRHHPEEAVGQLAVLRRDDEGKDLKGVGACDPQEEAPLHDVT